MRKEDVRVGNKILRFNNEYEVTLETFSDLYVGNITEKDVSFIPLTEEWLIKFGFEKQELTRWFGNGQDYQDPSSETTQQDYVLGEFFVRIHNWGYKPKDSQELQWDGEEFACYKNEWYSKCSENWCPSPKIEFVHQLQNIYFTATGKELCVK